MDLGEIERREAWKVAGGIDGMSRLSSRKRGKDSGSLLDLVDITDLFSLIPLIRR